MEAGARLGCKSEDSGASIAQSTGVTSTPYIPSYMDIGDLNSSTHAYTAISLTY